MQRLVSENHPEISPEIIVIKTTGDSNLESPLSEIGGKGVFVKEIEEALLSDKIDIAVHSLKDVPAVLPEGLFLGAFIQRHDPRDALITRSGLKLTELPQGARVGTGSLRRASQILHKNPALKIAPIRGNVDTRLRKLREGDEYDAIVLALAGLERMGFQDEVTEVISEETMVPAPGQGIVAVESRELDQDTNKVLESINHSDTAVQARAERAFLKRLSGDCNVPLGCRALTSGNEIQITGVLAKPDGSTLLKDSVSGSLCDAEKLGEDLADSILDSGGLGILKEIQRQ